MNVDGKIQVIDCPDGSMDDVSILATVLYSSCRIFSVFPAPIINAS